MSLLGTKSGLFVEFKENSIHVLDGGHGVDISLEREANGRISPNSVTQAANQLTAFFGAHGGPSARVAYCSIPARGVLLRRMSVPSVQKEEIRRLLTMQLEAQLPVPPNDLAWGCAPLSRNTAASNGAAGLQEFLVIALKKEFLDDYTRVLAGAGVAAEFTIGALARQALCSNAPDQFSVLETGRTRSEIAFFDARGAVSVRVLPWGADASSSAIDGALQNGVGQKLYVAGSAPFAATTGHSRAIEVLDGVAGLGSTPANLGLRRMIESGLEPIFLGVHETIVPRPASAKWKWAALAGLLALFALSLRYAEAVIYRSRLSRKLAAISAYRATLPKIEREFNFLNFIKTNQPPYIDTLTALGLSAPPGTRIETLSIGRHGELTLRANTGDVQAPGAFRSKLIDSGFFSRVVVDEQTPSPDGQKVTFRLSAQLRPDGARKPLLLLAEPKPDATNSLKTTVSETAKK